MIIANNIKNFLNKKLKKNNLKRKDFAQSSGILYSSVSKLINATRLNPELKNVIKIADFFNCSIDEVIERKKYYTKSKNYKFNDIPLGQINLNLRNYINNELQKNKRNPYKLSQEIGFSENTVIEFINNPQKNLSTAVIVALADYFKVSIDEMIGRVALSSNQKLQTLEKDKFSSQEKEKD